MQLAASSFASINISPLPLSTAEYIKSGCRHTARFAGRVHGVVVHMTTETFLPDNAGISEPRSSFNGNLTKIEGDFSSAYSISASARAVLQLQHQWIGFLLLKRLPSRANLPHSAAIVASYL